MTRKLHYFHLFLNHILVNCRNMLLFMYVFYFVLFCFVLSCLVLSCQNSLFCLEKVLFFVCLFLFCFILFLIFTVKSVQVYVKGSAKKHFGFDWVSLKRVLDSVSCENFQIGKFVNLSTQSFMDTNNNRRLPSSLSESLIVWLKRRNRLRTKKLSIVCIYSPLICCIWKQG